MAAAGIDDLMQTFRARVGRPPAGVWAAPGRVNLIGEHTDYNDGFVMPFALPQQVWVAAAPRADGRWRVTTLGSNQTATFGPDQLRPGLRGWQAYVAGVVWALREAGHSVPGADLVLRSTVPIGAGLSSSAALECATLTALAELGDLTIEPLERAKIARRAENDFVGAPTGLMDQAASTLCVAHHALFFDCRSLEFRQVPVALAEAGLELLVVDTRTPHSLVDSEYSDRRQACEEAAIRLGVPALRDVDDLDEALSRLEDDVLRRRVRHVVTENARVLEAVGILSDGDLGDLAPVLDASHASMRDDFEITVPTVDLAVETARTAGATGARMTGGGFGGCVIALVPVGQAESVAEAVAAAFSDAGFRPPSHFVTEPAAGAGRLR